jgi:hypothetical protein
MIQVIKVRILFLTIIKASNDLVGWITVNSNTNLTVFKFLMIGFKSFLASDVGILATKILNVGAARRRRFLVPEKLAKIINDGCGSCFIIPDIPQTFTA